MRRGRLISFEGVDGSGKSTQTKLLNEDLASRGIRTLVTAEPSRGEFGDRLRELILERAYQREPLTSALLFSADRCEHIAKVVHPALERGLWVVCDRFHDSTTAYQGGGEGVDCEDLATLHRIAARSLMPDLTILLDMTLNARKSRGSSGDYYDNESMAKFLDRVRNEYLRIAKSSPERIAVLDGEQERDKLARQISELVRNRLGLPEELIDRG